MSEERLDRYGEAIWNASRADEGTISATGAKVVAKVVLPLVDEEKRPLEEFVAETQRRDWDALDDAVRMAIRGGWSIECGSVAACIRDAALLVGPTAWDEVPWECFASGLYVALLTRFGVTDASLPDKTTLARTYSNMDKHFDRAQFARMRHHAARVGDLSIPSE